MPLYMDIHTVHGGATVDAVAQAHAADLKAQDAHDVRYLRYWVSEAEGKILCLIEAPSAEAALTCADRSVALPATHTPGTAVRPVRSAAM